TSRREDVMTRHHASRSASAPDPSISRRTLIGALGAGAVGASALALGAGEALAQAAAPATPGPAAPPTHITSPPSDYGPGRAPTTYFIDSDIFVVDPSFAQLIQPNAAITRLWTGALWAEGPAWSAQGRYLLFSDIPNNRQLRWIEDNGRVSVFRM